MTRRMASGRAFVFVDRDGTLVEDRGFPHRIEDYARLPGAAEGLAMLASAGFGLAIVTNQSGIGRGCFTESEFERFQAHLAADFAGAGVHFEGTFHCPHAPDDGCACRKPGIALLERARRELGAALSESWVVGDHPRDAEMALRAGCRAVHVLTGRGRDLLEDVPAGIPVVPDLVAAAGTILAGGSPGRRSGP